ncbi:MAG: tryptophan 2,3-dioxygenase family protein [Salibacteraceae bacterium]
MDEQIKKQFELLREKYNLTGQDIHAYLDGLLISNYLTYWDYVEVDTLLTLQRPKTDFPDEFIFIVYHQITELYFKLCLHELEQLSKNGVIIDSNGQLKGYRPKPDARFMTERINRINAYFEALTKSFDIMIHGMEPGQFKRFRMALLPASGFQSAQYRMVEIASTDLSQLVKHDRREKFSDGTHSIEEMFEHIYWKQGATDLSTGKKTLTLRQFEEKYTEKLIELAHAYKDSNLRRKYHQLSKTDQQNPDLRKALRQLDVNVNINWPLVHYKSAVRYLADKEGDVAATGGTNWQKYLPPRFQKRIFYPELWSEEEIENWGRGWVREVLADRIEMNI